MAAPSPQLPPPLIAAAAWILPGLGHVLLGQRVRGIVVGMTILALFALGLLIGGVRALEVPGYDDEGQKIVVVNGRTSSDPRHKDQGPWIMRAHPVTELRQKPWSIAQVLVGPMGLAGMAWSVWASTDPDRTATDDGPLKAPGVVSHARVNEIGVLYTAVAGMLNLLAIIDASHRAANAQAAK